MQNVYITRIAKYLPNEPVSNDEMESTLGVIACHPSRTRTFVLGQNGIKTRYYAIDKQGHITHNNAQLTAAAIANLADDRFRLDAIELLCCGTTTPDQLVPSHASMVHGILGNGPGDQFVCRSMLFQHASIQVRIHVGQIWEHAQFPVYWVGGCVSFAACS
jgi:3-oxoacyl-[acyl-carrier-protein] synthase III